MDYRDNTEEAGQSIGTGLEYLDAARGLENRCETETLVRLPRAGKKAPECLETLGMLLALLDQLACCAWGCPGKDQPHTVQRITGRAVSHTLAGLRLLSFGHYDEALSMARGVGEAANLLFLFMNAPSEYGTWDALDNRARWNAFRPAEVRKKIEKLGKPIPIEKDEYELLSGRVTHVGPSTLPQAYNPEQLPTLGGRYQEAGALASLNELAWGTAILGASAARLAPIPTKHADTVVAVASRLLESVGGVRVKNMDSWITSASHMTRNQAR